VIIGTGAFGASSALELARRGHTVTLLDRGPIPHVDASSTDISKMVRMDYGSDVFYHELAEAALDVWDQWNTSWPRPLFHDEGFLVLAPGPMAAGQFEFESHRVLVERGYAPQRLDGDALSRHWPQWNADRYPDGYLSPRGGWVESGAVVSWLINLCDKAGVRFRTGTFRELLSEGSRVSGVRFDGPDGDDILPADRVVLAAGAWTPRLAPWLSSALRAVAQPVVHFMPAAPEQFRSPTFPPFAADTSGTGWYGFPAVADGRVKLGHHAEGVEVDPNEPGNVEEDHLALARAFLSESIPALSTAPVVGTRMCLYCDSFDGDFLIDRDPQREGLVIAAGGSGHGFKFTPLVGSMVADAVEGHNNRWSARFRWRTGGTHRSEAARLQIPEGPEKQ
jgi:glycine/D-amino acid oxidase-like deaminating enzyme